MNLCELQDDLIMFGGVQGMSEMRALIESILSWKECKQRYHERCQHYPNLTKDLPKKLEDALNDQSPWHCNGLAFRLATYSDIGDNLFRRLSELLTLPEGIEGWEKERSKWEDPGSHWSKDWDRFFQFFWIIQCFEYFKQCGYEVTFPVGNENHAAPDLQITREGDRPIFVECTVYLKWWSVEIFLWDILTKLDTALSFKRITNLAYGTGNLANPLDTMKRQETLEFFARHLTPENIEAGKAEAAKITPYTLCEKHGFKILIEGEGQYQPDGNDAQGDPRYSRPAFIRDIVNSKDSKNQMIDYRPNILMANGLGDDFQTALFYDPPMDEKIEANNIDCLVIAACGMGERLNQCSRNVIGNSPTPFLKNEMRSVRFDLS